MWDGKQVVSDEEMGHGDKSVAELEHVTWDPVPLPQSFYSLTW